MEAGAGAGVCGAEGADLFHGGKDNVSFRASQCDGKARLVMSAKPNVTVSACLQTESIFSFRLRRRISRRCFCRDLRPRVKAAGAY
jgi:hypothetical protein